mgnify:FL=1
MSGRAEAVTDRLYAAEQNLRRFFRQADPEYSCTVHGFALPFFPALLNSALLLHKSGMASGRLKQSECVCFGLLLFMADHLSFILTFVFLFCFFLFSILHLTERTVKL